MAESTLPRYVFFSSDRWPARYSRRDSFTQATDFRPATDEEIAANPGIEQMRRSVYSLTLSIECRSVAVLAGGGSDILVTTYSLTRPQACHDQGEPGRSPIYETWTGTWKKESFTIEDHHNGNSTVRIALRRDGEWLPDTAPEADL